MAKVIEKEKTKTIDVQAMIDDLAEKANAALKEMESFDQEKVDHIVHEMAMAALDQHMPLAKMAVEETGRGVYEDKAISIQVPKNLLQKQHEWYVMLLSLPELLKIVSNGSNILRSKRLLC